MHLTRPPAPSLRPFVKALWAIEGAGAASAGIHLERVLPTGSMHLALRLSGGPLRVRGPGALEAASLGHAVLGGARASAYVREVSRSSSSVGVQFHPGAAPLLFGLPASELAERHTRLEEVCGGPAVRALQSELAEAPLEGRLAVLERFLLARVQPDRGVHPAVAEALERIDQGASDVERLVRASGYSHRGFIALFRQAVGLTPKVFCRVRRLQGAMRRLGAADLRTSTAAVAIDTGYSDQAHLTRDFSALAGLTPARYRQLVGAQPNHVPLAPPPRQVDSIQDAAGRPRHA